LKEWFGSAAVCLYDGKLLMVQGKDLTDWAVPSGGLEPNETLEECCVREVKEETGYDVEVINKILVKEKITSTGVHVQTHYFEVKLIGGERKIDDPDKIIHNVDWILIDDLSVIKHAYPEDEELLINFLKNPLTKEMLD
jgi:ADP-ribose pyrophosphatase YjhB (NUDIX family)